MTTPHQWTVIPHRDILPGGHIVFRITCNQCNAWRMYKNKRAAMAADESPNWIFSQSNSATLPCGRNDKEALLQAVCDRAKHLT